MWSTWLSAATPQNRTRVRRQLLAAVRASSAPAWLSGGGMEHGTSVRQWFGAGTPSVVATSPILPYTTARSCSRPMAPPCPLSASPVLLHGWADAPRVTAPPAPPSHSRRLHLNQRQSDSTVRDVHSSQGPPLLGFGPLKTPRASPCRSRAHAAARSGPTKGHGKISRLESAAGGATRLGA
jgi:hypothetical protein